MSPSEQSRRIKAIGQSIGLSKVAITTAEPIERGDYLRTWLADGMAGEMHYLLKYMNLRLEPAGLLEGARSIIVAADSYNPGPEVADTADMAEDGVVRGRVSRYVWGRDYHKILRKKLHRLADSLRDELGESVETRVCVDTAPIIEREVAARAGIGWLGKNTMVLDRRLGSYFFLGEILTTAELQPDAPATDHCGHCTRCLEACPTGALIEPYRMDARLCISYLTIEHRSVIDPVPAAKMGDWVYGCDICQEVCPYNRKAEVGSEPAYELQKNALVPHPRVDEVMELNAEQYGVLARGRAIKRASLEMMQRNAAVVKENNLRVSETQRKS